MYFDDTVFEVRGFISNLRTDLRKMGILRGTWYTGKTVCLYSLNVIYVNSFVLYQRIRHKPIIHVIGDSHVYAFKGKRPFIIHWIGPATAFNLNKPGSATRSGEKLFSLINKFSKKDIVMIVLGEIDCRQHIYMQFQKNDEKVSIDQLVSQTISNYGKVIKTIRNLGFITSACSVVPATSALLTGFDLPFHGSPQIRADIHKLFNNKLKEFCQSNDCLYINVHSKTSDKYGFLLREYAADKTHLNSKIVPIVTKQFQEEYGIIL